MMDYSGCRNLTQVYNKYSSLEPEQLLDCIRGFFHEAGKLFRQGMLSEEEFYLATDYNGVYIPLWEKRNGLQQGRNILNYGADIALAWAEWKETGHIKMRPWIFKCLEQTGDIEESAYWFFEVLDAIKFPITNFTTMVTCAGAQPHILFRYNQNTVELQLVESCLDIRKLTRDPDPVGKSFKLHFDGGTITDIDITRASTISYEGFGTISNYMVDEGKIEIAIDEDRLVYFRFNRKEFKPLQLINHTYFYPIPHPKWREYDVARLTRAYQIEAEFKALRLPYMLGIDEKSDFPTKPHLYLLS